MHPGFGFLMLRAKGKGESRRDGKKNYDPICIVKISPGIMCGEQTGNR